MERHSFDERDAEDDDREREREEKRETETERGLTGTTFFLLLSIIQGGVGIQSSENPDFRPKLPILV